MFKGAAGAGDPTQMMLRRPRVIIGICNAVRSLRCYSSWLGRFAVVAAFIFGEIACSCIVHARGRSDPVLADYGSSAPTIVTRAMWQAKPPLPGMSRQE